MIWKLYLESYCVVVIIWRGLGLYFRTIDGGDGELNTFACLGWTLRDRLFGFKLCTADI